MRDAPNHRYDQSMTVDRVEKITVSVPGGLVEQARKAVASGQASSVSAYIADAMAAKADRTRAEATLGRIFADIGTPGPEHEAWARRTLRLGNAPGRALA